MKTEYPSKSYEDNNNVSVLSVLKELSYRIGSQFTAQSSYRRRAARGCGISYNMHVVTLQ